MAETPPGRHQRLGAEVKLVGLSRRYGDMNAVHDVTLTVAAGEFLTLLGPSGSGKTTTLMMIAGFVAPSEGEILVDARPIVSLQPDHRNLGVVFQNYALFPHMTVFDNVAFPLRMRRVKSATLKDQVQQALDMVKLGSLGSRRTNQLSGGQQQRVALARALVFEPPVMLMDEPLGALDRKLRELMQFEVKRIQQNLGVTVIYVTHDQDEALAMSDRIAIMHEGKIHQVGTPAEIYERPATAFVADFVGESNILEGIVQEIGPDFAIFRIHGIGSYLRGPATGLEIGCAVRLMVRPEALVLSDASDSEGIPCAIDDSVYLGQVIRYTIKVGEISLTIRTPHRPGEEIFKRNQAARVILPQWASYVDKPKARSLGSPVAK